MTRTRLTVLFGLFALTLAGCGDEATLPEQAGVGPDPKLPPEADPLSQSENRPAKGWPASVQSQRPPQAFRLLPLPAGSTIRAGSPSCRMATCSLPRPTRHRIRTPHPAFSTSSRRGSCDEWAPTCRTPIASRCCAMPRRRHRRNRIDVSRGLNSSWHGAGRARSLRRRHGCLAVSLSGGRNEDHRAA